MIERESKSWTWVNERPCAECGFDASTTDPVDVPTILRQAAGDWSVLLSGSGTGAARLLRRPDANTWSPVEYACHVRDVLALLDHRIDRVLREDGPTFEDWHPNDRADAGEYHLEHDPAPVLAALAANVERVSERMDGLTIAQWQRRGTRADGLGFTLAFISTYLTHDVVHHVHDVRVMLGDSTGDPSSHG